MHKNDYGYVSGAVLFLPAIRKMRAHVEYEKFLCRVLKDDETTRKFKQKTEKLTNKLYAFRYNNEKSVKLTAAGRPNGPKSTTTKS